MEKALDQHDALADEALLPGIDLVVTLAPHRLLNQVVYPYHEHILVVRPIEDADHARRWQLTLDTPQVRVCPLLLGRSLERFDRDTLRVDHADGVAYHTTFS